MINSIENYDKNLHPQMPLDACTVSGWVSVLGKDWSVLA